MAPQIVCSACGYELGPQEEEVAHPDRDDNPKNPHFQVQIRDDGEERLQCTETGQLASPEKIEGSSQEDETEPQPEQDEKEETPNQPSEQSQQRNRGSVFDFEEEKDQMKLLAEVVTNPHYELTDDQISEVKAWAQDYDGQMPPNVLEDLVKNMKGVQKQTAKLMRQRYELKLNRWVRKQSGGDKGPPIGITAGGGRPMPQSSIGGQNGRTTPTHSSETSQEKPELDEGEEFEDDRRTGDNIESSSGLSGGIREERRKRRVERRSEFMDQTAEEIAHQMAPEVARELSNSFGTYFGLPAKIIEAKAEKDPDWFIERWEEFEEKLDIDVMDILEDSEAKKQREKNEQPEESQPKVDNELDEALQDMRGNNSSPEQPEPSGSQQVVTEEPVQEMNTDTEDNEESIDEDMFNEMFGGGE